MLGFVGLGTDAGLWYFKHRTMQGAADSAAFSAATAAAANTAADITAQAQAVAAGYGLSNGVAGVTVTVNRPPTSGNYTTNNSAIEVVIQQPTPLIFSAVLLASGGAIKSRAVAVPGIAGNGCVLALNAGASASTLTTGSATVNLNGCALFDNSSSSSALEIKGSTTLNAYSVGIVGSYTIDNNSTLTTTAGVATGTAPVADPYRNVQVPSYSGCTYSGASPSSDTTYSTGPAPTVFCNGLTVNAGATVTLNPGVYIINGGELQVNGGATLQGTGVTLVLTGSGTDYATVALNGNSTVNLSAPTSGATSGLALFQDRSAPAGAENVFNGGSTQSITGAIYFPSQTVTFTGGSSVGGSGCTQLIASQVDFQGNSTLAANCAGTGVASIMQPTRLVE